MTPPTPEILALISATFLLAGGVKGVIGLGLPTVSLGLLTAALDLTTAMALMVIPSLVTNLRQGLIGGHLKTLIARLWPFFACATVTVAIGSLALSRVDLGLLSVLLGVLLVLYSAIALAGVKLSITSAQERPAGAGFGITNGVLTGMTGSFVVPGVLFLQAIGLDRDQLIQAMGILFSLSTVAIAIALQGHALWTADLGWISAAAVIPALIGMAVGQAVRKRLSEAVFRKVFFGAIMILGIYIIIRAGGA